MEITKEKFDELSNKATKKIIELINELREEIIKHSIY